MTFLELERERNLLSGEDVQCAWDNRGPSAQSGFASRFGFLIFWQTVGRRAAAAGNEPNMSVAEATFSSAFCAANELSRRPRTRSETVPSRPRGNKRGLLDSANFLNIERLSRNYGNSAGCARRSFFSPSVLRCLRDLRDRGRNFNFTLWRPFLSPRLFARENGHCVRKKSSCSRENY